MVKRSLKRWRLEGDIGHEVYVMRWEAWWVGLRINVRWSSSNVNMEVA